MQQRRGRTDPLQPVSELRWLVIRDRYSRVLESQPLAARADLHAVMDAEGARRRRAGWIVERIPPYCAFFFCDRENERICISIEYYEPGPAGSARAAIRP